MLPNQQWVCRSTDGELAITDEGFQFLLTDVPSQLWVLLRKYVEMSEMQGGAHPSSRCSTVFQFQPLRPTAVISFVANRSLRIWHGAIENGP